MPSDDRICVGAVSGSFGVRGEARVKSFCVEPEDIASYGPLTSEDGTQSFTLKITRPIKGGLAARLSGITTKEAADALRGTRLYAPRSALPSLSDDEFYHTDLIGLIAADPGGAPLGKVTAVHNHGAGDLLELRTPGTRTPTLVPFTRAIVPTVDLATGRLVIDPPKGLLPDDA